MLAENFYLVFDLDNRVKPSDTATILAAIETKERAWKQTSSSADRATLARKKIGLALVAKLSGGLINDRPLWVKHHQQAKKHRAEVQKKAKAQIRAFVDIWGAPEIEAQSLKMIKSLLPAGMDLEAEVGKLHLHVVAPPPPGAQPAKGMEQSRVETLQGALERLGHSSIYTFLNHNGGASLSARSSVKKLHQRAKDIYSETINKGGTTSQDNDIKSAASTATEIFSSAARKGMFEDALKHQRLSDIGKFINVFKKAGVIEAAQKAKLISLAASKQGIAKAFAKGFVEAELARKHIRVRPAGIGAADRFECCPFCTAFNKANSRKCGTCHEPLAAECLNCGHRFRATLDSCTKCNTSTDQMVLASGILAQAQLAIAAGEDARARKFIADAGLITPKNRAVVKQAQAAKTAKIQAEKAAKAAQMREAQAETDIVDLGSQSRFFAARQHLETHKSDLKPEKHRQFLRQINSAIARADLFVDEARQAEAEGDIKAAIHAAKAALQAVADHPEAQSVLEQCILQPPTGLGLSQEHHSVVIAWNSAGTVPPAGGWQVVRSENGAPVSAQDGTPLARTSMTKIRDESAPSGVPLYYGVFPCGKDTTPVSAQKAAFSGPILLTAPVQKLAAIAGKTSVMLTWKLPPQATGAQVYRANMAAADSTLTTRPPVGQGLSSFADENIGEEVSFKYAVVPVYGAGPWLGAAQILVAGSNQEPSRIENLRSEGGSPLRFSWSAPKNGNEIDHLYVFHSPPNSRAGQAPLGDVSYKIKPNRPGRAVLDRPAFGPLYIAVMRERGESRTRSGVLEAFAPLPPPTKVVLDKATLALEWVWPDGITAMMVKMKNNGTVLEKGALVMHKSGATVGAFTPDQPPEIGTVIATLQSVIGTDLTTRSKPVEVKTQFQPRMTVGYKLVKSGFLRKQTHLVLSGELAATLPPVMIVARKENLAISRDDDGEKICLENIALSGPSNNVSIDLAEVLPEMRGRYVSVFCRDPADESLAIFKALAAGSDLKIS